MEWRRHATPWRRALRRLFVRTALLMLLITGCTGLSAPGSPGGATPGATGGSSGGAPRTTCLGPDVDWTALPPIAQAYGNAWNERDDEARVSALTVAFAEAGTYVDPTMDVAVSGREAFAAMIGTFLDDRPGEYFEPVGWADGDGHHGHFRMTWRLCGPQGDVLLEGEDIGVLDADGRIREVTGFFSPG